MKKPLIAVILGTARTGRESKIVADFVMQILKEKDESEFLFVDVKDYLFGHTIPPPPREDNNLTAGWRQLSARADGFIIITPEYNHGYPGELKILLDSAFGEYKNKPVGFIGVSSGGIGGSRAIQQLVQLSHDFEMKNIRYGVYFGVVGEFTAMNEEEKVLKYREQIFKLAEEVIKRV